MNEWMNEELMNGQIEELIKVWITALINELID